MSAKTIGIDLGKDKMHVVTLDEQGRVDERRVCASRSALARFLAKIEPARVAMETCAGAHFVGRKAQQMGHDARLLPGQYVRAYRRRRTITLTPRRRRTRRCARCRSRRSTSRSCS